MNKKAKRVSKFFVALFVFLLALALVLGSTGAYYRATRKATGTIQLQKGIVVNYTGFSGEDQEWTSANATSFELFDERSAVPGEEIELVGTSIKADPTSVNFYARAKIEYEFDGTNDGQPVSNIQNINGLPFTASDLITADVFASNWKESGNGDGWNYYVSGDTYGTFVAGGAYKNVFKTGAKLIIEGTNFNGGDNGEGGGYAIADTDYVITTIRASLVLEFIQANAGAVSDFGWNYTSQGEPIEDPAPATFTDNAGITYTLNNEGTGYIVTGGVINANGQGGSVSGYSAKIGNSSVSAYDRTYSYTIISYIHGLPVTEIAPNAFAGSSDVYIVIPTTIVLIGEGAINIDATVTFETGRLNSISIKVNAIPTGTPLPNGEVFDGTEADDVEELYTLTLIDEKDNYDSFWAGYIAEAGYTYQGNGTYTIRLPYGTVGQLPAPTFDGYTFQYWYDEEDEIQLPANQDLTIEGDVTATAVYTENQVQPETYEVTLYFGDSGSNITFTVDDDSWTSHDGGAYYTKIYSAGEIVLLPTATADDNTYAFSYWEGKSSYSEEIYEDREYYAQYTINYPDYTVTLYIEDGSWDNVDGDALGPWNYNYDSDTYSWTYSGGYDNIVLPSVDAGYYWYCDGMTYGSGEEFEAYAQDYSIYLKYEEQQTYTVELRFEELKYIDSFDASAFEDWTADYEDSTLIGYHKTVAENTEITLPDDGKTEGYAWTYNDGKDAFNPGVTYNVKENITFNYKSYNINPTYRITVYMEAGISKMFDSWDGWSQSDSYDGLYGFYKT
ncbi:MAG: hypothetical protein J5779_02940, partial [Clostridia bacterium]|nr:hypothetical protein [Clostridia bacterium]